MATLFGKLQEHEKELMNLEKHEKSQNKEKKEKAKDTEKKFIALKTSRYKSSTNDTCESESSDDDKDSNEDMGLFVRRYNRYLRKNKVQHSDKNPINYRRQSKFSNQEEDKAVVVRKNVTDNVEQPDAHEGSKIDKPSGKVRGEKAKVTQSVEDNPRAETINVEELSDNELLASVVPRIAKRVRSRREKKTVEQKSPSKEVGETNPHKQPESGSAHKRKGETSKAGNQPDKANVIAVLKETCKELEARKHALEKLILQLETSAEDTDGADKQSSEEEEEEASFEEEADDEAKD
ncbi:uncharacterized protein LOC127103823 [Lathyrus oleraceus]|uniref:uncharacterized protein LOC127103823 n=1 Tax=Pisum sativum TaxID=3888 RepID=UPI0021D30B2B|nr:uncharacterized protein LOC127103823 [Pisum sativum]